ncbi:exopolyphosphatase [uncultured Actinomyces sp.]|uniref:Ppx/GppA phosphatase family protein n=1 Tax=uncultured Actinomyces sp. TaxID=249061 RepID=UPI002624FE55|nr:exopolyphosphatase [uncultured Actinomyces sp.]
MTRVAAIDCGTNTIRLLVADLVHTGQAVTLSDVTRSGRIVRLGVGVDRTGYLDQAALERTLEATADFARVVGELGAERVRFIATSATRDARNREDFTAGVRRVLGVEPEVVSGQEEAELAYLGSLVGADPAPAGSARLVVDLGGGSTELVLGRRRPEALHSMQTGSVRITERYLAEGVTPQAEAAARADVRARIQEAVGDVDLGATGALVGLAGTITTVTAHALGLDAFDAGAIAAARLDVETVLASCDALVHSTPAQREAMGFLAPGRRDVIAAGALVWSEVVARVVADTARTDHPVRVVSTSVHDILDGIALSQI